ncbi:hypothetical protein [Siphonobacter sp. SORGH_AS_1065]|uniref:hypothetical protein n=1 Tax=Siphonobacter sp. SORGH_AS_1065 TaxID=3041795 RepID=UPI00278AC337|nr:hypothetical protein [Siphonobacter sp. SORGH_AS_1065]MDQ1088987.1 hypothetical protein [Siphonobacter sp. SORGH_AS_1065]
MADLVKNVKAIHQDLIRGDFARQEVIDLRGRLQTCQVENTTLETSLQSSQNREAYLNSELENQKGTTQKVEAEKKVVVRENWIWRGIGTVAVILSITSLFK